MYSTFENLTPVIRHVIRNTVTWYEMVGPNRGPFKNLAILTQKTTTAEQA